VSGSRAHRFMPRRAANGRRHTTPALTRAGSTRWAGHVAVAAVLAVVASLIAVGPAARADTTTNSSDNLLTSWYPTQPALSPQVVGGGNFGQLAAPVVDGQVYAQPLVSNGVLVVATENNNVYGFNPTTGATIWGPVSMGTPFAPNKYFSAGCSDIAPNVGVTSTPVIDPATGTVYLTSKVLANPADQSTASYVMHALSVTTGAEQTQLGFPVTLSGPADNDPTHVFFAPNELQRPALLLMNGAVYAAFGSHCDRGPYEGWVMGVSASSGSITARWTDEQGFTATVGDTKAGGGIWQAGGGLLSDVAGQLVLASGNGHTPPSPTPGTSPPGTLAQSVVRLSVQPGGTLKATDFFSPYNGALLNQNDSDIGSGPPIELPGPDVLPGSPFGTSAHPHVIVQVGKAGYIYLLDAQNMGGFAQGPSGSDATINTVQGNGVWGKPSVWPGDGGWVYIVTAQGGGGSGALKAYKSTVDASGNPTLAIQGESSQSFGYGSSPAIVTSDAMSSGSAVVWTIWEPDASGVGAQLQAYLPIPVAGTLTRIFSAPIGTGNKFTEPTADNGKIYVGTRDGHVLIFGTPVNAALAGPAVDFPTTVLGSSNTLAATFTANAPLTVSSLSSTSSLFTVGATTPALPATLAPGDTLTVPVTFTPGSKGIDGASLVALTTQGATAKIPLSGEGESAGPDLAVYPCCLSFGGVPAGTSSSNTVTLTNDGAATLHINGVNLPTTPYSVTGLPGAGSTIASGQSVTATVTFAPAGVGEYTNELTVATDGGNTSISLDGSGGTAPALQLSTTSLQYGQVPLGVTATQTFTVRNVGGTPLTITKSKPPQADNGFSADAASISALAEGTVIAPGASVQARVNFTAGTLGPATSSWVINANDGSGVRSVTLAGTGTAAPTPTVVVGSVDVTVPGTGSTTANFPVFLAPGAIAPVNATFTTHDGSAKASSGIFVSLVGAPYTIAPGPTTPVGVQVNASTTPLSNLKFSLNAVASGSYNAANNGQAWLNTTPVIHSFILPEPVNVWRSPSENTTVNVPIVLETPSSAPVKITATLVPGSAVFGTDYSAGAVVTTVTIPAGQTVSQLPVTVLAGGLGATLPLTFKVALSGASGLTKVVLTAATVTIYPPSSDVSLPPQPQSLAWSQVTPATNATVGAKYAYSFAAQGDPIPTFALGAGSALPPGVSLDSTGILAGTPTTAGDYSFTVVASNGAGTPITSPQITVHVAAMPVGPSFTSGNNPPATADLGAAFSYLFVATGQPAPTYAVSSGSLPPGLSLNVVSGLLSGSPKTAGTYTFTISADNGIDVPAQTPPLTITVGLGLAFTSGSAATAHLGQPFMFTVSATGVPAPTVALVGGTLPLGLTQTANPDGTLTVSGSPSTADKLGTVALTFSATNGANSPISQSFTLTLAGSADVSMTLTGPSTVAAGTSVAYTATVTNLGPSSLVTAVTVVFTLPAGTTFVSALNGGVFASGTVTWTLASLASGAHVNLKVTLLDSQVGTDTATVTASSAVFDPNLVNNTATKTNTVR